MKIKYPEFTASDLTAFALEMLRLKNYRVRRVNALPLKKRRNSVEPGWADIQGYDPFGLIVLCEVKSPKDRLSAEQVARLSDCHKCGGIALLCVQRGNNAELIPFVEYIKTS